MPISKRVRAAVIRTFVKPDADTVLHELARYRDPECDRVHLAILVLSNGEPKAVQHFVNDASSDYRDVLYWAEYPEDAHTGTREETAARYRKLGVPVPRELR